jgi:hypothetical protein
MVAGICPTDHKHSESPLGLASCHAAHVYHPKFAGSYSLKYVLPALVPDMTYEGMEVANGTDAGMAWEKLVRGGLDQIEWEELRPNEAGFLIIPP